MIRRPPRSTLFPYTSSSDLRPGAVQSTRPRFPDRQRETRGGVSGRRLPPRRSAFSRSEEHTSELQSLAYLVCRLLLEKKKNQLIDVGSHSKCIQRRNFGTPA